MQQTLSELLSLREQMEQTAQHIDEIRRQLSDEQQSLRQIVEEYGARRIKLLKQELHAHELTWCTCCHTEVPEASTELLFIEQTEEYTHGYGNMFYGFRSSAKLHRTCPTCRELATDKHGQKGPYDSRAKDQASFHAFRVEKHEDGYYARKFGNWIKLDDKNCGQDDPSNQLVEKLAEEWGLPPRIEVKHDWPTKQEMLVIHERVAMAKAS
ncbi:MAG: hypothetical protein COV34_03325 [Candidatus Zambryskibacteria bacterium CG10_big_fil_rev_8_21_14_0_10_42_12]|uniref:Uncharacterized protein n=1 Tax=Candidatus Zambryskibacteria bacterium CG10_big_fil_rev_8_21_14_0_10_42_12 TaxID=1975115 RepID=A0A2H0QSD5_9BACT|nr:MAG: hypothetical protein COV34_03325 [Candidatus Zambryskibacteria bacterium CG10_big_fil_rev_8_21_14_0_10_42_12]